MSKLTSHRAASLERQAFRTYIRRLRARSKPNASINADTVLDWIDKRTQRFAKRKGGL